MKCNPNLVGNKKTCTVCKNREPSYFMNKIGRDLLYLEEVFVKRNKNKWICDTCLS